MKILKSGIEMTPDELIRLRGGAVCACGCGTGFSAEQLNESGSGGCFCGCIPEGAFSSNWGAASVNQDPQV